MNHNTNVEERINNTIERIEQLRYQGKFDIYGDEYDRLIAECGANELMILGCKICKTHSGIKHIELPYHGISKRRIKNAVNNLTNIINNM